MLSDIITALSQLTTGALTKADPKERQKLAAAFSSLTDLSISLMRESPEFRQAFARIHTEFFKYPECANTIEQAMEAYGNYNGKGSSPDRPH